MFPDDLVSCVIVTRDNWTFNLNVWALYLQFPVGRQGKFEERKLNQNRIFCPTACLCSAGSSKLKWCLTDTVYPFFGFTLVGGYKVWRVSAWNCGEKFCDHDWFNGNKWNFFKTNLWRLMLKFIWNRAVCRAAGCASKVVGNIRWLLHWNIAVKLHKPQDQKPIW